MGIFNRIIDGVVSAAYITLAWLIFLAWFAPGTIGEFADELNILDFDPVLALLGVVLFGLSLTIFSDLRKDVKFDWNLLTVFLAIAPFFFLFIYSVFSSKLFDHLWMVLIFGLILNIVASLVFMRFEKTSIGPFNNIEWIVLIIYFIVSLIFVLFGSLGLPADQFDLAGGFFVGAVFSIVSLLTK